MKDVETVQKNGSEVEDREREEERVEQDRQTNAPFRRPGIAGRRAFRQPAPRRVRAVDRREVRGGFAPSSSVADLRPAEEQPLHQGDREDDREQDDADRRGVAPLMVDEGSGRGRGPPSGRVRRAALAARHDEAWSKTFRQPMIESTATKKCPGLSSGKVIFQNVRQRLVPSMAAAS